MRPATGCHLSVLLATGLVATSFPVVAAITGELDSLVLTLMRFALATVLFAPIVLWRDGLQLPGRRDLARYALLSACLVGFFWGMFAALRETSAVNTAAIFVLAPTVTMLLSALLLHETPGRSARLASLVGMLGAVWVVFRGDPQALLALELGRGDVIFFLATLAMGLYSVLVKYLHRGEPMLRMTFWTLATGTLWLLCLSAPHLSATDWSGLSPGVYAGIVYLAVFTTLVTFFVFQWGATVIGPARVMSYTYLNPLLVTLIGALLGQPLPALASYPGFVLVIGAMIGLQRQGRTRPDRAAGLPDPPERPAAPPAL